MCIAWLENYSLLISCHVTWIVFHRFLVRVSYLEIYNEEVRDLLSKNQNVHLEIKERPDVGVYVKDLSTYVVNNAEDMERIMTMGNKNRMILLLYSYIGYAYPLF